MKESVSSSQVTPFNYRIAGFRVQSDVMLFGSDACHFTGQLPDIRVRLGDVPERLQDAVSVGPNWQCNAASFLLTIPGVVRFIVTSGEEILVEPAPGVSVSDAAIFVAGTGIAIALYQRGALILHASAVTHADRAYAFSGASGAGKSTLAALLCHRGGCAMLSDDVSVVDLSIGRPALCGDGHKLRLWEDVIEWINLADRSRVPVRSMINKYYAEIPAPAPVIPPILSGIYILEPLPATAEPTIERLAFGKAAAFLDRNRYRRLLSDQIGASAQRFGQIARLLQDVPVYRLRRSIDVADNARTLACLKDHWESLA